MSRAATLIRHDIRLQTRYGIYYAYGFVTLFYALVLIYAARFLPDWLIAMTIYSDPAAVGFFFLGALMMLERAETSRRALAVTPVAVADYLTGKVVSLCAMGLVTATVIAALADVQVVWAVFLPATLLTSLTFVGLGVPIALRFRTVTGYLIGAAGWLVPVIAPAGLALLDPMPRWAMLVPTGAQFRLVLVSLGYGSASPGALALMFASTAAGAGLCLWLAHFSLRKEFGRA